MKSLVLTLFGVAAFISVSAQSSELVKWYHIERAQELAAKDSRPIFIDFTAAWCGWCKKMDKTTFMEKDVVKELNDTYYAVKVDFDSKVPFLYNGKQYIARDLAQEFGIQGLPTMIVVNADLSKHKKIVGYKKEKPFLQDLEEGSQL